MPKPKLSLHDIRKNLSLEQNQDDILIPKPTRLDRLFKKLRKLWCYKHVEWTDCSWFTPGAIWCGGNDCYEISINYAIPFWIKSDDAIADYTEKYCECDWLYW